MGMDLIDGKNGLCGEIAVAAGFEGYEITVIYRPYHNFAGKKAHYMLRSA
jgi:hypothetical protein